MTESADFGSGDGADQIAMTDDLFGWPGDGVHWAWLVRVAWGRRALGVAAVWPLRIPEGLVALDQSRPPGCQRTVSDECAASADRRPVRGWA
jgi:hypothetical protein